MKTWGDKPYRSLDYEMKERFGGKVYRLALATPCTCPNRDGTKGYGGCTFCSEGGSGEFAAEGFLPVRDQIEVAKLRVARKLSKNFAGYIAYFQSFSNTYGPTDVLLPMFKEAIEPDDILMLSVATRPDCLEDDMIAGLAEIAEIKPVMVELGLQTVDNDIAASFNRGYELSVFEDAVRRLKKAGIEVVVHVIIGLPGEDREMIRNTVRYVGGFMAEGPDGVPQHIDGIKLHLLHLMKGTAMGEAYLRQSAANGLEAVSAAEVTDATTAANGLDVLPDRIIFSPEEYADFLTELVTLLPEEMVIHRMTGDAPKRLLIDPVWTSDKKMVLNLITRTFRETGRFQGQSYNGICSLSEELNK